MGLKKKKPEAGPSFIKKIRDPTQNPAWIKTRYPEITKIPPIYIHTYNLTLIPHFYFLQHKLRTHTSLPQSSPSL